MVAISMHLQMHTYLACVYRTTVSENVVKPYS